MPRRKPKVLKYGYGNDDFGSESDIPCMVCVGGAPQPPQAPDVIKVSEDFPEGDEKAPFEPKEGVHIRANAKFEHFYEIDGESIGEGKFGKVYRCVEKSTGLELAAKFIKIRKDADRTQVEHEVAVMTRMRHPRIAQIYDAFYSSTNDVILVMELVKGGELFNRVVEDNYVLTETAAVMIICQLCEAIDYIHSQNIVHLDIKPENIMCVSENGNRIKLIDFGLARHYDGSEDLYYMAGTPEFSAPEVIKFEPLDFHTDMWSVGVIAYILLSGYSPFLGETTPLTYCNVERGEWEFIEEFDCVSEEAKDFISNLLVYDKSKRMLPKACLAHQWIAGIRERIKRDQKDAVLDQPNIGPAINTHKLKRYNIRRKFRKATFAVMSYCEFTQILAGLRAKNSTKGLEFFEKVDSTLKKKKKKKSLISVLTTKNNQEKIEENVEEEKKQTVADVIASARQIDIGKIEERLVQEENKNELRVDKKMQKTESSDSAKENESSILKRRDSKKEPKETTSKKILGSSELPPKPEVSAEVPKRKKSIKKPKVLVETVDDSKIGPSTSKDKPLRPASSADNIIDEKEEVKKKTVLKKTSSNPITDGEIAPIVKRKSVKKPDGSPKKTEISSGITSTSVKTEKDGEQAKSSLKTSILTKKEDENKPKKVEINLDASKSPSTSKGSFEIPKPAVPKANSLIAARLQKLNSDAPPLTFNVTGKKLDPPKIVHIAAEKPETKDRSTTITKGGKELSVVTEKKSTTTTTTSVRSKVENTEKKLTHGIGDKQIEETNKKSSTSQKVKVSTVMTAEEKCPDTGKPKTTVQKSVAKQEKTETAEEKNRREEEGAADKKTVKTTRSLRNANSDKSLLERLTKVNGTVTEDNKLEKSSLLTKKLNGKTVQEIKDGKVSLKDAEVNVLAKMKSSLRSTEHGKEEKITKEAKITSKILATRDSEVSKGTSLLRQLKTVKDEESPLKSALKGEGTEKKRKTVKLSEIILPHCKVEEGTTKIKFNEKVVNPLKPVGGFGLMKGKSEGNISAKVQSKLNISVKKESQDDSQHKKKEHWLFSATEDSAYKPKEDFTFASLKEKLERRVMGDPSLDTKRKETIKIPTASLAMNKWKQLEKTGN